MQCRLYGAAISGSTYTGLLPAGAWDRNSQTLEELQYHSVRAAKVKRVEEHTCCFVFAGELSDWRYNQYTFIMFVGRYKKLNGFQASTSSLKRAFIPRLYTASTLILGSTKLVRYVFISGTLTFLP